jgi:hypothetical protein
MSKMDALELEIRSMLDEGLRPTSVAALLNIPLEMVYNSITAMDEEYDDVIEYGYEED